MTTPLKTWIYLRSNMRLTESEKITLLTVIEGARKAMPYDPTDPYANLQYDEILEACEEEIRRVAPDNLKYVTAPSTGSVEDAGAQMPNADTVKSDRVWIMKEDFSRIKRSYGAMLYFCARVLDVDKSSVTTGRLEQFEVARFREHTRFIENRSFPVDFYISRIEKLEAELQQLRSRHESAVAQFQDHINRNLDGKCICPTGEREAEHFPGCPVRLKEALRIKDALQMLVQSREQAPTPPPFDDAWQALTHPMRRSHSRGSVQ